MWMIRKEKEEEEEEVEEQLENGVTVCFACLCQVQCHDFNLCLLFLDSHASRGRMKARYAQCDSIAWERESKFFLCVCVYYFSTMPDKLTSAINGEHIELRCICCVLTLLFLSQFNWISELVGHLHMFSGQAWYWGNPSLLSSQFQTHTIFPLDVSRMLFWLLMASKNSHTDSRLLRPMWTFTKFNCVLIRLAAFVVSSAHRIGRVREWTLISLAGCCCFSQLHNEITLIVRCW